MINNECDVHFSLKSLSQLSVSWKSLGGDDMFSQTSRSLQSRQIDYGKDFNFDERLPNGKLCEHLWVNLFALDLNGAEAKTWMI
jgi:hypothetical protein